MSRGVDRQVVFRDLPDHQVFVAIARDAISRHGWRCLSYSLVRNHYHLLVAADPATLGPGMRELNGRFAQYVNRRRGRTGHLWENRFRSVPITRQSHLLEVVRYIALNPVRAGLCEAPADWTWTAHGALAGLCRSAIVDADEALTLFHPELSRAREAYLRFVGVVGNGAPSTGGICEPPRPTIEEIATTRSRDEAIAVASIDYGYSVREIAEAIGCHFTTAARAVRTERVLRGQSP